MTAPPDELLAELGWLRRLARRLARDAHRADDLVQDACALALAQPTPPRHWRAWLATVVAHLLQGQRRSEAARRRREQASARATTGADDGTLQRAEAQHRLAAAVLRLDEPYRTTVLLRFFDGLPPRRIARQLGVPVTTVHSRLQRALARLRSWLDHDCGGRAHWLAAFAPFAHGPLLPLWPALLMPTKLQLAAAAAAFACSLPFWWPTTTTAVPTPAGSARDAGRAAGSGPGTGATTATPAGRSGTRVAAELPPADDPARATAAVATHPVQGRVCDGAGRAVAGVAIGRDGQDEPLATSDAQGAFAFATTGDAMDLAARDERYVTVLSGSWSRSATIDPVVVVAPALRLGGRVVDSRGAPVAGAEVALRLPDDFDTRFVVPLDRTGRGRWVLRSGPDGVVATQRLPRLDGASLLVTADAFAPATVPLPPADDEQMTFVLQPFHFAGGELRGRVVDAAGAPAAGARVAMGVTSVVSAADGSFVLGLRRAGWPTAIVAAKAGHRPARCELPRHGGARPEDWPQPLELRLGPAPQSVRGHVVDGAGQAVAGAEVWLADPTPLGIAGLLPLQLEYLIGGGEVPRQAARMPVPRADDPTDGDDVTSQHGTPPRPSASWFYATTDGDGAFELPGLLDRPYRLRALDPVSGRFAERADVHGGTTVELVVPRDGVWPELRGRVVSRRGVPLAGVQVQQMLVAFELSARVPGGRFEGSARRTGATATTDADGSFVLHQVGRERCEFLLTGDTILPRSVPVAAVGDPRRCEFVVDARCQVEVALADPGEADAVRCVDAAGQPLQLAVLRRNSQAFHTDLPLHAGRSGRFVVGEDAAALVLQRGEQVVRRIPFTPDPQRVVTLQ